ncbi:MAG: restriction endonuclease subunit S [Candidatus Methanoperedens sp.]|nr:restriction endonuclease subunit S [Candidatus Methanoperedens sp.]
MKDGPHVSPNYVEDGVPFISVHNIINGFFDMSDLRYISYEDHKEFCRRCKPEKGDVLYSKGGTTGFAKRVDVDFEFSIWVHLALLKFSKEIINPIFLETCLNSNYCKVQAKINTRGIANKDLVLGRMAGIKIILPPLPLQQKFARIVEKIESMRQSQNQSKQQIEDLFSALMQKAFRGEI